MVILGEVASLGPRPSRLVGFLAWQGQRLWSREGQRLRWGRRLRPWEGRRLRPGSAEVPRGGDFVKFSGSLWTPHQSDPWEVCRRGAETPVLSGVETPAWSCWGFFLLLFQASCLGVGTPCDTLALRESMSWATSA